MAATRRGFTRGHIIIIDRKSRTRSLLLDAAATCFAANGVAATTMEDVARTAGVTRMTLYRHLPSRDDLIEQVILQTWAHESAIIEAGMALHDEPAAQLTEAISVFVSRLVDHPFLLLLAREEAPKMWAPADDHGLLARSFGAVLRPHLARYGDVLRGDVDDTVDWLLRQALLLVQMAPGRSLGPDEIRRQAETFIVPGVLREPSHA